MVFLGTAALFDRVGPDDIQVDIPMRRETMAKKTALTADAAITSSSTVKSELAGLFTSGIPSSGEAANLASAVWECVDCIPTVTRFCARSLERNPGFHCCHLAILVKCEAPLMHESHCMARVTFNFPKFDINCDKGFAPSDRLRIIGIYHRRLREKQCYHHDPNEITTKYTRSCDGHNQLLACPVDADVHKI